LAFYFHILVSNFSIYRPYILLNNCITGRKVFDSSVSSNPLEMLAERRKERSSVIYSTYQHFPLAIVS